LYEVTLLNYCITSNHVHLLVIAAVTGAISRMMQKLEGDFAGFYNRRKGRSGAFWEDRFHCTMVDDREYFQNCMLYIDLNMVRARAVNHPRFWPWCGYAELTGARTRYRMIDLQRVVQLRDDSNLCEFRRTYPEQVQVAIDEERLERNRIWTECIAVGGPVFLESIAHSTRYRRRNLEVVEGDDGMWVLQGTRTAHRMNGLEAGNPPRVLESA
jgi:putative transposase